jgi:hypothetical protein
VLPQCHASSSSSWMSTFGFLAMRQEKMKGSMPPSRTFVDVADFKLPAGPWGRSRAGPSRSRTRTKAKPKKHESGSLASRRAAETSSPIWDFPIRSRSYGRRSLLYKFTPCLCYLFALDQGQSSGFTTKCAFTGLFSM